MKSEYRALGADFDSRNDLFEESLPVLRAVWSGRSVAHDGVRFSTQGVTSMPMPMPIQDPIPIWIGGNSQLERRRGTRHARGRTPMWNPAGRSSVVRTPPFESVADLAGMIAVLARQVVDTGRYGPIDVAITLPPGMTWRARTGRHITARTRSVLEATAELDDAGVTVLVINLPARDPQEFTDTVESFGDEVIRPMTAADRDPTPSVGGLERFTRAAALLGVDVAPVRYPQGTRTAADAAAAISCDVSQIAKSLVLACGEGFVLALTAGHHRVDFEKLARLTGEAVKMADPDQAREVTGFSIGGTPPFAHANRIPIYIDTALMSHGTVYGAAGTPDTCFPIAPSKLLEVTGAVQADFVVG